MQGSILEGSGGKDKIGSLEDRAINNALTKLLRNDTPADERALAANFLKQKGIPLPPGVPEVDSLANATKRKAEEGENNRLFNAKKSWFENIVLGKKR